MYRFPTILLSSLLMLSLSLPSKVLAVNLSSPMQEEEEIAVNVSSMMQEEHLEDYVDATTSSESLDMSSVAPEPVVADQENEETATIQPAVDTSPTEAAAQENSASMSGSHQIWYDVALGAAAVAVATLAIWLVSDTGHGGTGTDLNKIPSTPANSQSTGGGM